MTQVHAMRWPRLSEKRRQVTQTKQAMRKSGRAGGAMSQKEQEMKNKERDAVSDCEERDPASGGSGDGSLIKVLSPQAVRRTFGSAASDAWARRQPHSFLPPFQLVPQSTEHAEHR